MALCVDFFNKRGQLELEEGGDEPKNNAEGLRVFDLNFLKDFGQDVLDELKEVGHACLHWLLQSVLDACP
jgi:hypothetical protein